MGTPKQTKGESLPELRSLRDMVYRLHGWFGTTKGRIVPGYPDVYNKVSIHIALMLNGVRALLHLDCTMSHADALIVALRKAAYFKKKYFVWGFQSTRNGKWYYTVSADRPAFMPPPPYLKHIT